MILRKPYAFLIKHFRVIHLFLSALLIFIVYRTNAIYTYFNGYVNRYDQLAYNVETSVISVGFWLYLAVFLAIGIFVIILVLMNRKEKPIKYYLFSIISYSLLIIILLLANSQLFNIAQNQINIRFVSAVRDLLFLGYAIQFIFIVVSLIRGVGFNIKKFDFQQDLKELSVLAEDNEEFELDLELDTADVKTKFRRYLRIGSYVLKENKKLFAMLIIVAISIFGIILGLDRFVYNRVYSEGQTFRIGDLQLKILNSYETIYDYHLNDLSQDKYIYYVVEVNIENTSDKEKYLSLDYIKLNVDQYTSYVPKTTLNSKFLDFGQGYMGKNLAQKSSDPYIFVFELPKEKAENEKTFEVLSGITREEGQSIYHYTKTKLNAKEVDKVEEKNTAKLGENLEIKDNIFGNLNLKIEEYSFHDLVTYEYEEMINEESHTFTRVIQPSFGDEHGRKIMQLKMELTTEEDTVSSTDLLARFLGNFGHFRFVIGEKEYQHPFEIKDVTPSNAKDYRYLEVLEKMEQADHIYLDVVIRNQKYTYELK